MKTAILVTSIRRNRRYTAELLVCVGVLSGCAPSVTATRDAHAPSTGINSSELQERDVGAAQRDERDLASTASGDHPLLDDREPDTKGALPELIFNQLGMHIGGESNAPQEKEPFFHSIAKQEEAILNCYRWVNEPEKGGSFGVDLYIHKSGGTPEIRAVRQKIGGPEFVECMTGAFLKVEFQASARPTMLSYSMRFRFAVEPG
jgi:hypothetical protein